MASADPDDCVCDLRVSPMQCGFEKSACTVHMHVDVHLGHQQVEVLQVEEKDRHQSVCRKIQRAMIQRDSD